MSNLNILHGWTEDGLNLQGFHWVPKTKDTCIVFVHGMSENIIESYFSEILGQEISKKGFGFIYGHNRGYGYINDIRIKDKSKDIEYKTRRIGEIYERFEECIFDIDLWVQNAKKLGYNKIILMGHSLGCNKIIHYYSKKNNDSIIKIILASPPDIVGLCKLKRYQPNYNTLLKEAKDNVKKNKPRKILKHMLWDCYPISSQTFLDVSVENCPADNLPLLRNPKRFVELEKIDVPTLAFNGEFDDTEIRDLEDDLKLIKEKAINCKDFTIKILKNTNHNYNKQENVLADMILDWLKKS